jgi:NAD(P)-dependent dehydrogenase (short-subunit alcohol dehydrogenase family)
MTRSDVTAGPWTLATPEDVARTIAFLVRDLSHPATGANLEILSSA